MLFYLFRQNKVLKVYSNVVAVALKSRSKIGYGIKMSTLNFYGIKMSTLEQINISHHIFAQPYIENICSLENKTQEI